MREKEKSKWEKYRDKFLKKCLIGEVTERSSKLSFIHEKRNFLFVQY